MDQPRLLNLFSRGTPILTHAEIETQNDQVYKESILLLSFCLGGKLRYFLNTSILLCEICSTLKRLLLKFWERMGHIWPWSSWLICLLLTYWLKRWIVHFLSIYCRSRYPHYAVFFWDPQLSNYPLGHHRSTVDITVQIMI